MHVFTTSPSSSGLGHLVLIQEITGSTPVGDTYLGLIPPLGSVTLDNMPLSLKLILITIISILAPITALFFTNSLIISIITGILTAGLSALLIFLFLKPLADLIRSAQSLGLGNFNSRADIRSGDEFEAIGKSFNLMADNIKKIFEDLEHQRDGAISERSKLDEVISSIVDGIVALDFNKNVILLNKAAEEITGFSQSELIGRPIDQLVHLFSDTEEILPKIYCQPTFNQTAKLVGKDGKEADVNFSTAQLDGKIQTNVSCILILHDIAHEEELEKMKLDFVSMASHELRTPLTSIIGYLSVFLNENKDKVAKEEMDLLEKSLTSAQQLLVLVQNLLSVNKIEREQMTVSSETLDYLPIITKVVEDLKTQAVQKNIILNFNIPVNLPKINGDAIRLPEVITNLIANAINYTNAGGKIDVSLEISPNEVTTTISDTGIGIPKEAIPHLFNKFFRVSNQSQQASKGTGLGLYISKSIIEKLGGKIWVESVMGEGSKFIFTLPIAEKRSEGVINSNYFVNKEIQGGALNY